MTILYADCLCLWYSLADRIAPSIDWSLVLCVAMRGDVGEITHAIIHLEIHIEAYHSAFTFFAHLERVLICICKYGCRPVGRHNQRWSYTAVEHWMVRHCIMCVIIRNPWRRMVLKTIWVDDNIKPHGTRVIMIHLECLPPDKNAGGICWWENVTSRAIERKFFANQCCNTD